jgi:hypothetical protein
MVSRRSREASAETAWESCSTLPHLWVTPALPTGAPDVGSPNGASTDVARPVSVESVEVRDLSVRASAREAVRISPCWVAVW